MENNLQNATFEKQFTESDNERSEIQNVPADKSPLTEEPSEPSSPPAVQEPEATPQALSEPAQEPVEPEQEPEVAPQEPIEPEQEPEVAPQEPVESEQEPEVAPQEPVEPKQEPEVAPQEPIEPEPETASQEPIEPEQEPEVAPQEPIEPVQEPEVALQEPTEPEQEPETASQEPIEPEPEQEPEIAPQEPVEPEQEAEVVPQESSQPTEEAEEALLPELSEEQPEVDEAQAEAITDYANMSRKELVATFERLLQAGTEEAAETLNREAELIKAVFYKLLLQERKAAEADDPENREREYEVDDWEIKLKKLYAAYKQRRAAHAQLAEQEKEENLAKKLAIIEELKALLEKQEDLNQTFPAFRALQQHWRKTGPVPVARTKDVWDSYQYNVERFYDYVKINNELRDLDLKKNMEAKIQLCEKAEALLLEEDILGAFHQLQQYHEQWREIGPVAHELREQVWERFRNATSAINKKQQDYFDQQHKERQKNLEAKRALCEKAEAVANTKVEHDYEWHKLSKEMDRLQKEWKDIGQVARKDNTKIYERFRAACNKFYAVKREFHDRFKAEMQENTKLQLELIEQAEALKDSEDWRLTTDKLIGLQKQWKEVGPVGRKKASALWVRFHKACDAFFERKQKYFSAVDEQHNENLQRKEGILQEIEAFKPGRNKEENLNALQDFQNRWMLIGFVPLKDKERIQTAYRKAIHKQFAALQLTAADKKIIRFKSRIEDIQQTGKADRFIRSEREKLIQELRQLEADVALWENNIGFFAKSKNAEALTAEVNRKIAAAKEEIYTIEGKIKLIDKQYE
jgi:hypothetical protein